MPWGKHDDKFHRSRKVKPLRRDLKGLAALGLRSLLHSECLDDPELDGRVTRDDLRGSKEQELCEMLADAGLLDRDGDDYLIHDWADYNPTKSGLSQARNKTRERVAKHRERQGNSDVTVLPKRDETVTLTRTQSRTRTQSHSAPTGAGSPPPAGASTADNRATWEAYSAAYEERYGTEPKRNAKTNGQIAQIVKRLGADEAPAVAAHFVGMSTRFYVERTHSLDCLVKDAEGIRTQWATGRVVTAHEAREADRRQGKGQEFIELGKRLDAEVQR